MNVTEQTRVGKDQVGNGVKETTNHNSQALVQTTEKDVSDMVYLRIGRNHSPLSAGIAVVQLLSSLESNLSTVVIALLLSQPSVIALPLFIAPLERRTML